MYDENTKFSKIQCFWSNLTSNPILKQVFIAQKVREVVVVLVLYHCVEQGVFLRYTCFFFVKKVSVILQICLQIVLANA